MNQKFYIEDKKKVDDIINSLDIKRKEKKSRLKRLKKSYNNLMINMNTNQESHYIDDYLTKSHEIKSFQFLRELYDNVKLTLDSKNQTNFDAMINNETYVEFVCVTKGADEDGKIKEYMTSDSLDVKEELEHIYPRATTIIYDKKKLYYEKLKDGKIFESNPYILLVGLGILDGEFYINSTNFEEFLSILIGMGNPIVSINQGSNECIEVGRSHRTDINKNGDANAKIGCNIFTNNEYDFISAILLCTRSGDYCRDTTVLYVNPNARNKLDAKLISCINNWTFEIKDNEIIGTFENYKSK